MVVLQSEAIRFLLAYVPHRWAIHPNELADMNAENINTEELTEAAAYLFRIGFLDFIKAGEEVLYQLTREGLEYWMKYIYRPRT